MKGQGIPGIGDKPDGDLLVEFAIKLPDELSEEDQKALDLIDSNHELNPREDIIW